MCGLQEAGGILQKLESEVAEQQKVSIKAQSDCRSYSDTLKSTRGDMQRLEKQAASVIGHLWKFFCKLRCMPSVLRCGILLQVYVGWTDITEWPWYDRQYNTT